MPDPAKDRLKNRHEYIFHFVPLVPRHRRHYYYDQLGYAEKYGNGTGPSDVWSIGLRRDVSGHLAPYPVELVDRILTLACPEQVCTCCGQPRRRIVKRTAELDPVRPQAKRALQLAKEGGLTDAHIAAIQATGISDAGKAMRVQTGTVRNSETTKQLAAEAKAILGGYFREFTFAKRRTVDIGPTAVATARSGPELFSTLLWGALCDLAARPSCYWYCRHQMSGLLAFSTNAAVMFSRCLDSLRAIGLSGSGAEKLSELQPLKFLKPRINLCYSYKSYKPYL